MGTTFKVKPVHACKNTTMRPSILTQSNPIEIRPYSYDSNRTEAMLNALIPYTRSKTFTKSVTVPSLCLDIRTSVQKYSTKMFRLKNILWNNLWTES